MELKSIFKMVKTNRYTQDGRDEIAKLQAEEVEDVKYKTGDISQKTGLQKQPDGSWAPPKKGGKPAAKKEAEAALKKQNAAEIKSVDKEKLLDALSFDLVDTTADIEEEYNAVEHSDNSSLPEFVRQEIERDYVNKTNGEKWSDAEKDIIAEEVTRRIKERQSKSKPSESKPAAKPTTEELNTLKDIMREYRKNPNKQTEQIMNEAKSHLMKNRGMTPEQLGKLGREVMAETSKPAEKSEGGLERRDYRAAMERNPRSGFDFKAAVSHSIPTNQTDYDELNGLAKFMNEEKATYQNALKSRAQALVDGHKSNGDWYPEKEQSIMKIAKAVGYDEELHKFIEEENRGYDLGYSEDAAPKIRELTGDCRIRIRKEKPKLTGDTKIRIKK